MPRHWLWWGLLLACAVGLGACGDDGGGEAGEPLLQESRVPGFGEVAFRVVEPADPAKTEPVFCALRADTEVETAQGLTGRQDLAGYDGMLFWYDREVDLAFHMRDTPVPLSIAWFDVNGEFVSSTDMEPCLGRADCPEYRAASPYRYALEVPRGSLTRLKIGPGTAIDVGGPCRTAAT